MFYYIGFASFFLLTTLYSGERKSHRHG